MGLETFVRWFLEKSVVGDLLATGSTFCNFAALLNAPLGELFLNLIFSIDGLLRDQFFSWDCRNIAVLVVFLWQLLKHKLVTFFFKFILNQQEKIEGHRSHFVLPVHIWVLLLSRTLQTGCPLWGWNMLFISIWCKQWSAIAKLENSGTFSFFLAIKESSWKQQSISWHSDLKLNTAEKWEGQAQHLMIARAHLDMLLCFSWRSTGGPFVRSFFFPQIIWFDVKRDQPFQSWRNPTFLSLLLGGQQSCHENSNKLRCLNWNEIRRKDN